MWHFEFASKSVPPCRFGLMHALRELSYVCNLKQKKLLGLIWNHLPESAGQLLDPNIRRMPVHVLCTGYNIWAPLLSHRTGRDGIVK